MDAREFLKSLTGNCGKPLAQVARNAGVSRQYLYYAVSNASVKMSLNMMIRLLSAFGYKLVAMPEWKKIPNECMELTEIAGPDER